MKKVVVGNWKKTFEYKFKIYDWQSHKDKSIAQIVQDKIKWCLQYFPQYLYVKGDYDYVGPKDKQDIKVTLHFKLNSNYGKKAKSAALAGASRLQEAVEQKDSHEPSTDSSSVEHASEAVSDASSNV